MTCGACNFAFSPQPPGSRLVTITLASPTMSHKWRMRRYPSRLPEAGSPRRQHILGDPPISLVSSLTSLAPKCSAIEMEPGRWTEPGGARRDPVVFESLAPNGRSDPRRHF